MTTKIQIRRDTAENWSEVNPKLLPGELGIEIDTLKIKIGPNTSGGTFWNDITEYANIVSDDLNSTLEDYILSSQIGSSGGVVGLNNDANAIVPGDSIVIEGSDLNSYETKLQITEPTADRTITIPDVNGTIVTTGDSGSVSNTMLAGSIPNNKLANSSVTINGYEIALGGSASYGTDNINEGTTNLYFTNERAQDAIASAIAAGTHSNITISYNDASNTISFSAENGVSDSDTDDLNEGSTNLYFTDERAQDAVGNSLGNGLSYNDTSGAISVDTTAIQARVANVSDTEIGYLNGVTSGIQEQINLKAALESPALTGTATAENLTLSGNLIVNGTNTILNTDTLQIEDNQIILNSNVSGTPSLNASLVVKRGVSADVAIIWDETSDKWQVDSVGGQPLPIATTTDLTSAIDISNTNLNSTINTHTDATTNVHGIADTAALALKSEVEDAEEAFDIRITSHEELTTNVHGIADTAQLATKTYADDAVSTHALETTTVHGIADTSELATNTSVNNAIDIHNLDTTNVHGIADTAQLATKTYADSAVSTHNSATTNVHGISDTAALATKTYADGAVDTHNLDTTNVHGIADTSVLATNISVTNAVDGHSNSTTNIHGIADTSALATKTYADDAADAAELASNTYADSLATNYDAAGSASGALSTANSYTDAEILEEITNRNLAIAAITTADVSEDTNLYFTNERAQDAVGNSVGNGLKYTDSTGVIEPDLATSGGLYIEPGDKLAVDGYYVTFNSADQTLTNKTLTSPKINEDVALTATATELNYVDGVTSAIQTQIDSKASLSGATFTGDVNGTNLTLSGDLTVYGTTNTVNTSELSVADNLIYLNQAIQYTVTNATGNGSSQTYTTSINHDVTTSMKVRITGMDPSGYNKSSYVSVTGVTSNTITVDGTETGSFVSGGTVFAKADVNPDLGFSGGYNDGTYHHAGLFRDSTDGIFKFFDSYQPEPAGSIDTSHITFSLAPIQADSIEISSATIGNVSNTELQYLNGVTGLIQDQIDSKLSTSTASSTYAPIDSPTFTGTISGITKSMVGLGNVDNTSDVNKPISTLTQSALDLKSPIASPTFTGLVTLSGSGIAFTDGTQTKQGVPSQTYIYGAANSNAITSSTTLSNLAYRDAMVEIESTSGVTITIPADSTTNFPIGTSIDILQTNTGQVTIAGDGFTPNATPGLKLRTRWSSCTLQKRGSNSWVVFGDLTA